MEYIIANYPRPWSIRGRFLCPSEAGNAPPISLYPPPSSRRLRGLLWPPGGYFCARVQHGSGEEKNKNRRKGHLQARHGVLYPCGCPYIPAPQNGPQGPLQARAWHKSTPARSVRSKPGHYAIWTPPARQALPGVLQPLRGSRPLSALA